MQVFSDFDIRIGISVDTVERLPFCTKGREEIEYVTRRVDIILSKLKIKLVKFS